MKHRHIVSPASPLCLNAFIARAQYLISRPSLLVFETWNFRASVRLMFLNVFLLQSQLLRRVQHEHFHPAVFRYFAFRQL